MEKMYQQYKDVVEFKLVYIKEAHASDSRRPVQYAREKGITEHDDYQERCSTAEMLLNDESLHIPFLIDHMDDSVNKAYAAWPDRIYLVQKDGRIAVAAERGPWGFEPALNQARQWIEKYKKDGKEPDLPTDAVAAGNEKVIEPAESKTSSGKHK